MRKSIIAAHDMVNVIGFEGKIPWHIPDDLKRFKSLTMGKPIIMGRKTFESIGRPLPGRLNIIITSNTLGFSDSYKDQPWFNDERIRVVHSYEAALVAARGVKAEHVFIIGGERVYRDAMKDADDMYITVVFSRYEGDAHFPEYSSKEWDTKQEEEFIFLDENDESPDYAFYYLERRKQSPIGKAINYLSSKIPGFFKRPSPT
jgi:dihydrofolate reductase